MGSDRDETIPDPDRYAAVAFGKLAFETGLIHGRTKKNGGTQVGRVVIDQEKSHVWVDIYWAAWESSWDNVEKGYDVEDVLNDISRRLNDLVPSLLRENKSSEEMREETLFGPPAKTTRLPDGRILRPPVKPMGVLAIDLAAYHVGMYAANLGTRFGLIDSDWQPSYLMWFEAFESARQVAILAAQEQLAEQENTRTSVRDIQKI